MNLQTTNTSPQSSLRLPAARQEGVTATKFRHCHPDKVGRSNPTVQGGTRSSLKIFLFVCMILAGQIGWAQWSTNGSNVYYNGGNVGIGTTNPIGKFQITDNQLDIFTSQGLSNSWTKDGLTISANPDVNYSSLRINSNHSSVSDRGVLNVTRSSSSLFYVRTDGNIGIGTINPVGKFQITDDQLDIFTSQGLSNGWTKDGLTISANPDVNYSSLRINSNHSSVSDRGVLNVTRSSSSLFYVRTDGNVGIGTTTPDAKLTVNGTIHSKEVKVDLSVPGPDYVFEEDYPLTSLDEIESYIKQNKHLPEVPSAAEFEENGIKVGEMNMLLLKKLEEVTLHLIRQQEEIDSLKEQMKKQ